MKNSLPYIGGGVIVAAHVLGRFCWRRQREIALAASQLMLQLQRAITD